MTPFPPHIQNLRFEIYAFDAFDGDLMTMGYAWRLVHHAPHCRPIILGRSAEIWPNQAGARNAALATVALMASALGLPARLADVEALVRPADPAPKAEAPIGDMRSEL